MQNKFYKALILTLIFSAMSGVAIAGNPGKDARECVQVENRSDGKIYFVNRCSEQVFVLWCGDMKYSRKQCGDDPKGGFYTFSANISAGRDYSIDVKNGGNYRYASCYGSISFGKEGYEDNASGGYSCLPTGRR